MAAARELIPRPPGAALPLLAVPAWEIDAAGQGLAFNAAACDALGFPAAALCGRGWLARLEPSTRDQALGALLAGAASDLCVRADAGPPRILRAQCGPPDHTGARLLVATDISDLHARPGAAVRAQAADTCLEDAEADLALLRQQHARQQVILDHLPLLILHKDTGNHVIEANPHAAALLDCPLAELVDQPLSRALPHDAARLHTHDLAVLRTHAPHLNVMEQITTRRGERRFLRLHHLPCRDATGALTRIVVVGEDVSADRHAEALLLGRLAQATRRQAEVETELSALYGREQVLNVLLDAIPAMVMFRDCAGNVLRANRRVGEFFRVPPASLVGMNVHDLVPAHAEEWLADDRDVIAYGVPSTRTLVDDGSSDGFQRSWQVDKAPWYDEYGVAQGVVVVVHDVTAQRASEDALRRQTAQMRLILDNIPSMILVKDDQNNILHANRAVAALTGLDTDELVGIPSDAVFPDPEARNWREDREVLRSGQARYNCVHEVALRSRPACWMRYHKLPYHDPDGRAVGIVVVLDDISEDIAAKRGLEDALALARQRQYESNVLFDSVPVNLLFRDLDNRIQHANRAATEFFGIPKEALVGRTIDSLFPGQSARILADDRPVLEFGRSTPVLENEVLLADGRRRWLRIQKVPYIGADDRISGILTVFDDITDERRRQRELEQTVDQLTASNRELERFAHVASHDLKEPLRMIVSFTNLLETDAETWEDAQARQYLRYVSDGATRMHALLEDLLEYSRLGREVEFEPVDLDQALVFALANLRATVEESGAVIRHAALPRIHGNMMRLTRLLQNLVHNAIKYSSADRAPRIDIEAGATHTEWRISVSDNGIGMANEHLERIFEPFRRLHSRDRYPGTGIGLALCRRIVEGHGGRIWATSTPGTGSTFHFTVPRQRLAGDAGR